MAPVVTAATEKYSGTLSIQKVDAEIRSDLTRQFGVRSVPTFIAQKNGVEVFRHTGALTLSDFEKISKL
jgi:thioredoxin-like negative regulator of GroEL